MKIAAHYSHLNGEEFLQVHQPALLDELKAVIGAVNASKCKTKVSRESRKLGNKLWSPVALNTEFRKKFRSKGWDQSRTSYWVTEDAKLIRKTLSMPAAEQKAEIEKAGLRAIYSYNQTDFVKRRVAVEVQFGKYSFVAYDLFVKHLAFYVGDVIDVGVEILPMKRFQEEMSSGIAYYEGELYNLIREGRGVPGVPLLLLGVDA